MNISEVLLDILKKNGSLEIPEFGVFTLQNSRAKLKPEDQSILPPAKKIIFSVNFQASNSSIIPFLSKEMNVNEDHARFSLKTQTDFWKKKISVGQDFDIHPFGKFIRDNEQLIFVGNRVEVSSPDFYGLEAISLADIKDQNRSKETKIQPQNYRFHQSVLWIFLLLIPVAGLLYLGITNAEYLFGNKTFDDVSYKKATHRIDDQKKQKIQNKVVDSLKIDSLSTPKQTP